MGGGVYRQIPQGEAEPRLRSRSSEEAGASRDERGREGAPHRRKPRLRRDSLPLRGSEQRGDPRCAALTPSRLHRGRSETPRPSRDGEVSGRVLLPAGGEDHRGGGGGEPRGRAQGECPRPYTLRRHQSRGKEKDRGAKLRAPKTKEKRTASAVRFSLSDVRGRQGREKIPAEPAVSRRYRCVVL